MLRPLLSRHFSFAPTPKVFQTNTSLFRSRTLLSHSVSLFPSYSIFQTNIIPKVPSASIYVWRGKRRVHLPDNPLQQEMKVYDKKFKAELKEKVAKYTSEGIIPPAPPLGPRRTRSAKRNKKRIIQSIRQHMLRKEQNM